MTIRFHSINQVGFVNIVKFQNFLFLFANPKMHLNQRQYLLFVVLVFSASIISAVPIKSNRTVDIDIGYVCVSVWLNNS